MDSNPNWNFSNMFQNPNFQTNPNPQNPNLPENTQNPFPHNPQQNFSYPQNNPLFPFPQYPPNVQYPMFGQSSPYFPNFPFPSQPNTQSSTSSQSTPVVEKLDSVNLDSEEVEEITPKATSRTRWSKAEDYLLISSWLNNSKDSIVGTDQTSDCFWNKITNNFNAHVASVGGSRRSKNMCKDHFNKAKKKVTAFAGCYKRISAHHQSGWNDDDYLEKAHAIYKQENGQDFQLMHWWEKLKDEPKFRTEVEEQFSSKRTKVSESGAYTSSSNPDKSEGSVSDRRPIGKKVAKKGKGKGIKKHVEDDEMLALEKEKLAIFNRVAAAKEAKVEVLKAQSESSSFNKALDILTKSTTDMNEDQLANHKAICNYLKKKYDIM